ncbi:alginate lyase family protein [Paenibacillus sp. GP183]|uniref:alginate lyase family protein n=1 Tax=Paenibacillus sp. GP183 TaxID=1882751 RepID=UPI000898A8FA|nr:alginate lyase family protein [Paenibacillus sp. GP183]SEB86746.1 Copper amine oxidase N-terminal domain-containing protein [Paenibacillus sp. GP183]
MSWNKLSYRIIFCLLLAFMLSIPCAFADSNDITAGKGMTNSIVLTLGKADVFINGNKKTLEAPPVLDGDYTLVPFRFLGEALGAKVDWYGEDQSVTLTLNGKTIALSINSKAASVSGNKVDLDAPAKIINGFTMVPLRFVGEALNQKIDWDAVTKRITIQSRTDESKKAGAALLWYDQFQLAAYRNSIPSNLSSSLKAVLNSAAKYEKEKPPAVTDKSVLISGASPHDFVSMAIYYWPDSSKTDGKPYIRKDGQINPEKDDPSKYDADRMSRMITAVDQLSLAYILTGKETYASAASKYLRAWFLDDSTKMNPHMNYAQGIPGKSDGTPTGIIDGYRLISVVDSVHILESSESWTTADDQGMKAWFSDYLKWMQTSKPGQVEGMAANNHGVWYDAQTAAYAWFVGQNDLAKLIVEEAKKKRIDSQIEPDGTMPLELQRTKSLHYTVFNLEAFISLARVGEQVGNNLWDYTSTDGRSLKRAILFALPYVTGIKQWELKDIEGTKPDPLFARFIAMASKQDESINVLKATNYILGDAKGVERIATSSFSPNNN